MARYRIDSIAALARQMSFTPHDVRAAQVAAAEELLHAIDPAKAYPPDFVIFRVTGYHPKSVEEGLLAGMALQHDLGLLIEQVSDSLDVQTASVGQPVMTIEEVTEKFNVTSKTIQRWRRKGLPARRFLFPDGKRRVGFLPSSVERFFAAHRDQVARGMNFSQVADAERDEIVRRARRLAVFCNCCAREIARRIGRRLNRSPITVLHTIRKHDEENASTAVFPLAAEEVGESERGRILRGYRRGLPVAALARRACRPRSAIYRVILEEKVARLDKRKVRFIDDPLYHGEGAEAAVDEIVRSAEAAVGAASGASRVEEARVPRDLPPYLQELYRTPLLTPARERALFLKFNFHKCQFIQARRRLDPQFTRGRDLNALEALLRKATDAKNDIVRANLRLVVSVARKHLRPGQASPLSLMELVSEGNITLMRAVEGFDVHRGHRFSTYATLALMKGFARSVPQMLAGARAAGGDTGLQRLAEVPDARPASRADGFIDREEVRQLLSRLDDRERHVVLAHYGLEGQGAPATFEQVARELGLTRQRVRQIEQGALAKLRSAAAEG